MGVLTRQLACLFIANRLRLAVICEHETSTGNVIDHD